MYPQPIQKERQGAQSKGFNGFLKAENKILKIGKIIFSHTMQKAEIESKLKNIFFYFVYGLFDCYSYASLRYACMIRYVLITLSICPPAK